MTHLFLFFFPRRRFGNAHAFHKTLCLLTRYAVLLEKLIVEDLANIMIMAGVYSTALCKSFELFFAFDSLPAFSTSLREVKHKVRIMIDEHSSVGRILFLQNFSAIAACHSSLF